MVDVRVWGKEHGLIEPYPLIGHLLDTGVVAGALWDGFLAGSQQAAMVGELGVSPDEARSLVVFWAGLHDVGKIQSGFQFQRDALRHASSVALLADDAFVGLWRGTVAPCRCGIRWRVRGCYLRCWRGWGIRRAAARPRGGWWCGWLRCWAVTMVGIRVCRRGGMCSIR